MGRPYKPSQKVLCEVKWPYINQVKAKRVPRSEDDCSRCFNEPSDEEIQFNNEHKLLYYAISRCGHPENLRGRLYPPYPFYPRITTIADYETIGREVYLAYIIDCICGRMGWTKEQVLDEAKRVVGWRWGMRVTKERVRQYHCYTHNLNYYLHLIGEFWAGPSLSRKTDGAPYYLREGGRWVADLYLVHAHEASKWAFTWEGVSEEKLKELAKYDKWEDFVEPAEEPEW